MKKIIILTFLFFIINVNFANASTIKSINVIGNDRITKENIINYSQLSIGQNVDNSILNKTLKKIYFTENFADVSINDESGNIVINVLEAPIIGDIFFIGSDKFDADEVKKSLSTKSRQIYSKSRIKLDTEKLYITFKKMGFLNIHIEPKVVFLEDNSVDIIFNITEGEISYIKDVYFTGNNFYSDRKLKELLQLKPRQVISIMPTNGSFEEEKIEYDKEVLINFYKNNGFANAKVLNTISNFDKKNYNFTINYYIDEGLRYQFGKSTINNNISNILTKQLEELIQTKQGKIFSLEKIQLTLQKIKEYLNRQGYVNISLSYNTILNDEGKIADIIYNVNVTQKVYVDKITIIGNENTKNNVIMREMEIHEGDIYDQEKIDLSRDKLYMTGFFKNVEIKIVQIPNTDLINLNVIVDEQFSGKINASVGYSGFYGLVLDLSLSIENLFGRGFLSGINISKNGFQEAISANFYDPYFFTDKYKIGLGFSGIVRRFGELFGSTQWISGWPYKGWGYNFNVNTSFEIINRLNLSIGLSSSLTAYKLINQQGSIFYNMMFAKKYYTHAIDLSLTFNKMNRYRFATKGYLLSISTKIAGLSSQQFMQNIANAVANIQIFGEDLILHLEASGGIITQFNKNALSGMESAFSLGGYSRMRGFDFFSIGPQIGYILNGQAISYNGYSYGGTKFYYLSAELRSPLFIPKDYNIYFSVFVDAGSAFGSLFNEKNIYNAQTQQHETIIDSKRIRVSVGAAITWNSPIMGEIGFYYAKPVVYDKNLDRTLEFGIKMGHSF